MADYASACLRCWVETPPRRWFHGSGGSHGPYARVSSGCAVVYRYPELPGASQVKQLRNRGYRPGGYQVGNFRRRLPSGTIISAMQPVVSGCIMISTSGSVCRAFCCLQRCFNVMIVCRVPRLISSPRMTVFMLQDCVCHNHKHNEANGEEKSRRDQQQLQ